MVWTLDHIMWIVWYSMVYGMIWYDGDGHLPKSREVARRTNVRTTRSL